MKVSVVIETITARYDAPPAALPDSLSETMAALDRQTFRDFETIIVTDDGVDAATEEQLRRRYPTALLVHADAENYFANKNAGAVASRGEFIALLDSDCVPAADWLDVLLSRFDPGVSVVAGRTRYTGNSLAARTFSVPDFAHVISTYGDAASGFNINNMAYRREVFLKYPFDARIRRNGGCYFNFYSLREAGLRVVYEPRASVSHGLDIAGLGFVRKHYDRGYDGVGVYRVDERGVLRGTRLFKKFGGVALVGFTGRRILIDWARLARHRRQIGISVFTLPYYCAVSVTTRLIELAGGLTAVIKKS